MTDLSLRRDALATDSAVNNVLDLLKQIFSATPLGLVFAAFGAKR